MVLFITPLKTMKIEDLKIGDLIFFISPTLGISEHTSIFLGTKNDIPYILHATTKPYSCLMVTRLKNEELEFSYHVMRPQNIALAIEAITILLGWVEYQIPYSSNEKIAALMEEAEKRFSFELKGSAPEQMKFGTEGYTECYSKYIDMLNMLPYVTKTIADSGVGCAESIVLAFNLALLMLNMTYENHRKQWITPSPLVDFMDKLENPLPFDAQKALSAGLLEYCSQNPEHWINLGLLEVFTSISIEPEEKNAWRTFKAALQNRAKILIENHKGSSPPTRTRSITLSHGSFDSLDIDNVVDFSTKQLCTGSRLESPLIEFFTPSKFCSSRFSPLFFEKSLLEEQTLDETFRILGVENF